MEHRDDSTRSEMHTREEMSTMDCDSIWDLLSVYADGEASTSEAADVERHIAGCPTCARDLEFMRGTATALHDAPEVRPPASLHAAIMAATVDRPALPQRLADAVRRTLTPAPVRYGSLATVGAAAAVTLFALRGAHQVATNPVLAHPGLNPTAPAGALPSSGFLGGTALLPPDLPVAEEHKPRRLRPVVRHPLNRIETAMASHPLTVPTGPKALPARRDRTVDAPTSPYRAKVTPGTTSATDPIPDEPPAVVDDGGGAPPVVAEPDHRTIEASAHSPATGPEQIQLVASSAPVSASQAHTLAELTRALRKQAPGLTGPDLRRALRDREIRVDVLKGTF